MFRKGMLFHGSPVNWRKRSADVMVHLAKGDLIFLGCNLSTFVYVIGAIDCNYQICSMMDLVPWMCCSHLAHNIVLVYVDRSHPMWFVDDFEICSCL